MYMQPIIGFDGQTDIACKYIVSQLHMLLIAAYASTL